MSLAGQLAASTDYDEDDWQSALDAARDAGYEIPPQSWVLLTPQQWRRAARVTVEALEESEAT